MLSGICCSSRDFPPFGINAVARQAGCDKVLIYRYFNGLEGLLMAFAETTELWWEVDEIITTVLSGNYYPTMDFDCCLQDYIGNGMSGIDDLVEVMKALRDPNHGCPWDIKQTSASIASYTLEETHEALDAIERDDMDNLKEELGD